ncbi:MAG: putative peptidoglycan glycosyltransferase FtsW [Campylobacterota bacterium]|nr:putative peptidoglycan glycosyltransferase FtsW [Campylobacterota bacterium]
MNKKLNLVSKLKNLTDKKEPDYTLFFISSALIIIGIIFSYSLSVYTVIHLGYDQFHFLIRQLFAGILSILVMWSFAQIKPSKLLPIVGWSLFGIFGITILLMPIIPSSFIVESGGASRWIRLPGISIAPVEFFKIGFVYYLAHSFHRRVFYKEKQLFLDEIKLIAPYGVIFLILAYFIAVVQKDLGQTVVIGTIIFMMLFFANRSIKIFLSIFSIAIVALGSLVLLFPHRIDRIKSWWGMVQDSILPYLPTFIAKELKLDTYTEAYQVGHAINAIHNGSMFGEGISNGYLKLGFLGEVHTDFVLAGITEEVGFFGISVIVLLFSFLIIRIFRVSRMLNNTEYHLFTIGIAIMLGTAFIINAFGTSGIIPIKGLAVPFLSYGGSSLLASSIAIGLVLSISRDTIEYKKKKYED